MNGADLVNYVAELELPDCSMSFNGLVLEEEVPGYRTNSITGRDSLSAELTEYDNGYVDGSTLLHRKFPSRDITVNFTILASDADSLRDSFDKLRGILYARGTEEVQIIFKDENDRFYLGTVTNVTGEDFSAWDTASNGSITIHCSSPFKWSIEEFEAAADEDGTIIVDYDGTYKAYPVLHAQVRNESLGYIGFVNDRKNIIQLGNPDELDYDLKNKSTTLINDNFVTNPEALTENWTGVNNLTVEDNDEVNRDIQTGSLHAVVAEDYDFTNIGNGVTRNFTLASILNPSYNARWSGASRKHVLTLDEAASNFTCTMNYVLDDIKPNVTNRRYIGDIRLQLAGMVDGTKRSLASVRIFIGTTTENRVCVDYSVINTKRGRLTYTPALQSESGIADRNGYEYTPAERRAIYKKLAKSVSITKKGNTFEFNTPAGKKTVKASGSSNYTVTEVGIWMLGLAKVESVSTTVKSADTQFIDGKKTEGLTTIASSALPSSTRNPTSEQPIRVVVYGQKTKVNRVAGKAKTVTTTDKKTIKIAKKDTNYETGLLDTVINYNSSARTIRLLNRKHTWQTVRILHVCDLKEQMSDSSKTLKTLGKNTEVTYLSRKVVDNKLWYRVEDKTNTKGYLRVTDRTDWYELKNNEEIRSDGYKWYLRGTYYYTGPDPDRKFVESMGIRSVKLVKKEYDTYVDIPNPFSDGDQVDVDCNTGEIQINGLPDYNVGALGNDWEEFCLYPGPNAINCSFSDWAVDQPDYQPPVFTLTYRKAYI